MTPPDEPDEQPSALSRLERALAGFGDPARNAPDEEPEAAVDEPEPEPVAPSLADDEDDEDDEDEVEQWEPGPVGSSSSVLDIASAVDAVERLSAAQQAEEPEHRSAIEVLEEKWAREEPDELPRFEPAEPRSSVQEFDETTDAEESVGLIAEAEAGLPDEIDEEFAAEEPAELVADERPLSRVTDAAASWERNQDASLPYFLVEDNRPVAAEPVAAEPVAVTTVPTLEELRQIPLDRDEKHDASVVRTLAEIPILLIVAALIAFLVKTFLAQAYYIPSGSMLPQLQIDDRVVVSKLAYKAHDPRRGDIIVFDDPRNGAATEKDEEGLLRKIGEGIGVVQPSTDEFIKRVIGLPGDTVEGRDGHVFVNGHRLYEPYLEDNVVTSDFPETKVRAKHLWVMGDNRSGSADSRVFGQIDVDTIVGRAVVTVWPFGSAEFL